MFSLLTLLDDIATTFDDVAIMSKVAMEKTSALMSDDLAVNAAVVHGVSPDRELPMVKSIFIGSLLNKVYVIIGVMIILAIYPPILNGILLIGGLFLAYEGAHKVFEKFFHFEEHEKETTPINENQKVKGAIRTDLILSIEIIVIAKSSLSGPVLNQVLSLILVGLAASVLIYGLVGFLVKIDDMGLRLIQAGNETIGNFMVKSMPFIMKSLGIIGTIAMFLVGGGIIAHTFHWKFIEIELLQNLIIGVSAGTILIPIVTIILKLFKKRKA